MKNISSILAASILAIIFFSNQINASGYGSQAESTKNTADSMTEAIKHAEMAKAHGDDAKEILKHAEISLKYANDAEEKAVEKMNVQGVKHITASITHLREAIEHARMGHADAASKHINKALNEMYQSAA